MADTGAEIKSGWNAVKNHWVAFLVAGVVLVIAAFAYEHKNPGAVSGKLAKIPGLGKLFS